MCDGPDMRMKPLLRIMLATIVAASAGNAFAQGPTNLGSVQANAQGSSSGKPAKTSQAKKISKRHVFKSGQSVTVLRKAELKSVGPFAGAAQALQLAPGVSVSGYGVTGSTKNSISINGIKQGWGGFSGSQIDNGSLSVTFDGVPMANPSSGLWQTDLVPQLSMIQGIGITYGPGDPEDRWFNNIGGQIGFVPVQPSNKFGGSVGFSVGSDSSRNYTFQLNTGTHDGWSTVLAGGTGSADSYRQAPDGFDSRSKNYAVFLKTRKTFDNGDFSVGIYQAKSQGYRPLVVPTTPVAGVTVYGTPNTPLYSQQTTGFYSTLPGDIWRKDDTNKTRIIYAKLNAAVNQGLTLHNLLWYQMEKRLHQHYANYGLTSPGNLYEYNNPSTSIYGDKFWGDLSLPYNLISTGVSLIKSTYNSRNSFYNPADLVGTSTTVYGSISTPNGHYRSNYFDQTDLAVFAQDKISPTANLDITPGIRFINYWTVYSPAGASDFATSYALAPGNDQGTSPGSTASHHKWEPSISANLRVLPWLSTFANYAETYKEPTVGGGGGLFQTEPPIYKLEQAKDYNLGFKIYVPRAQYLRHFLMSVAYFHLRYLNQFIPLTTLAGDYVGDALGDSTYRGVNLSLADDLGYHVGVFAHLNIEKADFSNYTINNGGLSYSGLPVSKVPLRTFSAGVSYKAYAAGALWVPALSYEYTGPQYMWSDMATAPTNQKMPAYGLWNFNLDATVPLHQAFLRDVVLNAGVLNLTNKQYNVDQFISGGGWFGGTPGYTLAMPGAPRTYYAGLKADF